MLEDEGFSYGAEEEGEEVQLGVDDEEDGSKHDEDVANLRGDGFGESSW